MEVDKKVAAAISTAVTAYIRQQKVAEEAARKGTVSPAVNLWGQSGRQEIMRNRQMWQLRIVPG